MPDICLPESVLSCMDRLEAAGFRAYAVGGCVRDGLLGIECHDFDLCTSALPEQTRQVFREYPQELMGQRHGTVRVTLADTAVEITTFRSDGSYADNRHPDAVRFVSTVEEDLIRRDFTVNAIGWSPRWGFADPFGGRADLEKKCLRTVGEPERRFREDALRILRGMRFAARFGLEPEPETLDAMNRLSGLTEHLARERVYEELSGFLTAASAKDLLQFSRILSELLPELLPTVGFLQHSPHHHYDVFTHTAYVTEAVPREPALRWAALLHDTGKVPTFTLDENGRGHFYGHAQESAVLAEQALTRLRAPAELRRRVVWLIERHMTRLVPEKTALRRCLSRFGREDTWSLLALQEADMRSKGVAEELDLSVFEEVRRLLTELEEEEGVLTLRSLAVNGNDMMQLGLSGRSVGVCLNRLLEQVLAETLPNEKTALLKAAEQMKNLPGGLL